MRLAPSIVSRQITEIERQAGMALFDRSSRGVALTEAGDLLHEHSNRLLEEHGLLIEQLDQLRNVQQAKVRIWCGEGFLADLVEHGIRPFSQVYPSVRYSVHFGGTAEVAEAIFDGNADIGIVYHPVADIRVRSLSIRRQPLCVVLPEGHALSGRVHATLEECLSYPIALLDPGHGVTQLVTRVAANAGYAIAPALETNSIDMLRRFVGAGLGITFLPNFAVASELDVGSLLAVPLSDATLADATAHVLVRSRRRLPQSVERLATYIANEMLAFRT